MTQVWADRRGWERYRALAAEYAPLRPPGECVPLGEVAFTDLRQGEFGFARECEGVCGV